jgi:hypothetical protein
MSRTVDELVMLTTLALAGDIAAKPTERIKAPVAFRA